jgi:hypothetical protein
MNYEVPNHVIFSSLLSLHSSWVQILKIQGTFILTVLLQQETMDLNGKMEGEVL